MGLNLEDRLLDLLNRVPYLYESSIPEFAAQQVLVTLAGEDYKRKLNSVKEVLSLGKFIQELYLLKLENMFNHCRKDLSSELKIPENELSYEKNADSMLDFGKREYFPSFSGIEPAEDKIIQELRERKVILPSISNDFYRALMRCSDSFDKFSLKYTFSESKIASKNQNITTLEREEVRQKWQKGRIPAYSTGKDATKKGMRVEKGLAPGFYNYFLQKFKPQSEYDLECAQETIDIITRMVYLGSKNKKDKPNVNPNVTKSVLDQLYNLKDNIAPKKLKVGFHSDWKEDYETYIELCTFKSLDQGGKVKKIGNRAYFSLLFGLDPTTHLLFFMLKEKDFVAQAVARLFDVEDVRGNKYVLLERVVMNNEFTQIELLPEEMKKYSLFNPSLAYRQPYFDLMLYYSMLYAHQHNRNLFINMTDVTGTGEYGPHEFLHYLTHIFPNLRYDHALIDDPRPKKGEKDETKKLITTDLIEGGEELYLKKDNHPLLKILNDNGIDLSVTPAPDEPLLINSDGELRLLNHVWSNPKDYHTWVNSCRGMARGKIIPRENMAKILRL